MTEIDPRLLSRLVVADTETTGLEVEDGHKVIEIAGIEIDNGVPTGRVFHRYVNPGRDVPAESFVVHGISSRFLARFPSFATVWTGFEQFVGGLPLVFHHAAFDVGFINAELEDIGRSPLPICNTIDTLEIVKRRFPGSPASLDALCRRFNIDRSGRAVHGALLDAQLLGSVFLELIGGRQQTLGGLDVARAASVETGQRVARAARHLVVVTPEEAAAHEAMLDRIKTPVWRA